MTESSLSTTARFQSNTRIIVIRKNLYTDIGILTDIPLSDHNTIFPQLFFPHGKGKAFIYEYLKVTLSISDTSIELFAVGKEGHSNINFIATKHSAILHDQSFQRGNLPFDY